MTPGDPGTTAGGDPAAGIEAALDAAVAPPRPGPVKRAVQVGLGLLAFGALLYATVTQWGEVGDALGRASAGGVALAFAGMAAGTFCSMLSWRAVLADLGSPLRLAPALRIFFVGQLGKYLPGSLWPVVAQMELGRAHGVPRKRSAVAALLVIVVALTAGGLLAAATLPWAAAGELRAYRWVFLAPAAGLVLLVPSVFAKVTTLGLRVLRRQPLEQGLSGRGVATALAWAVLQWALWGVPVWLLTDATLPLVLGAYALAWIAGFVFLVAPAGAGVREGALVLLLGPAIGNDDALGVAIVARLLTAVADLVWGVAALLVHPFGYLRSRRTAE